MQENTKIAQCVLMVTFCINDFCRASPEAHLGLRSWTEGNANHTICPENTYSLDGFAECQTCGEGSMYDANNISIVSNRWLMFE